MIYVLKNGDKSVSEIAKVLEQAKDAVLQNLKRLVKCYLVVSVDMEKEKEKVYRLNLEIIGSLSELLEFHVEKRCPGFTEPIPADRLKQYMREAAAKTAYIEHE